MRQLSIRALMAVIVLAAIGLVALRNCSPAWSGALLSITFFALTSSLLGIAFGRDGRRVYWIGFATLGWMYVLLWFVPPLHQYVGQHLLARSLFIYIEQILHPQVPAAGFQSVPVSVLGSATTGGAFPGATVHKMDPVPCVRIGVAFEALIWAALGGRAATYFASRPESLREPGTAV